MPRNRSAPPIRAAQLGTLAPATATSFFPAKPLGCYGDGGAVLTDDAELVADAQQPACSRPGRQRQIRQRAHRHDQPPRHHPGRRADRKAEDLSRRDRGPQPGRAPLCAGPRRCRGRAARSAGHDVGLGAIHRPSQAGRPRRTGRRAQGAGDPDRDLLSQAAAPADRPTGTIPADGGLPVSDRLADEVISLPMHAYLDEPTQDRIVSAVRNALGRN